MKQNKDYLNFLKDKRVIIVGPAKSLLERGNGKFIDSFDVVVRVNRGIEPTMKFSDKIGSRTDILYNCMLEKEDNGGKIDLNLLKLKQVKFVSYHSQVSYQGKAEPNKPHHLDNSKLLIMNSFLETHMIDYNFYNSISSQVNCRPNTGFIAIFDLLFHEVKELYITGYTFYMDGFMTGYKDHLNDEFINRAYTSKRHVQKNLFQYLKKNAKEDNRIKTDPILTKILTLDNLKKNDETLKYVFS
jgi:hypothetical protein